MKFIKNIYTFIILLILVIFIAIYYNNYLNNKNYKVIQENSPKELIEKAKIILDKCNIKYQIRENGTAIAVENYSSKVHHAMNLIFKISNPEMPESVGLEIFESEDEKYLKEDENKNCFNNTNQNKTLKELRTEIDCQVNKINEMKYSTNTGYEQINLQKELINNIYPFINNIEGIQKTFIMNMWIQTCDSKKKSFVEMVIITKPGVILEKSRLEDIKKRMYQLINNLEPEHLKIYVEKNK
jgi:hypothetical protein